MYARVSAWEALRWQQHTTECEATDTKLAEGGRWGMILCKDRVVCRCVMEKHAYSYEIAVTRIALFTLFLVSERQSPICFHTRQTTAQNLVLFFAEPANKTMCAQKHVKYDNFNLYWNITAGRWLYEAYRVVDAAAYGVRRWRQCFHIQWNLSNHYNNTKSKSSQNNLRNGTSMRHPNPHAIVNNNGIDAKILS